MPILPFEKSAPIPLFQKIWYNLNVEAITPEFALLRYRISGDFGVPWADWQVCADAVMPVFRSCKKAGSLTPRLPSGRGTPLCGDVLFRAFAKYLIEKVPGIPFFVFGGKSELSRELLFASLSNIQAVSAPNGESAVRYPAIDARKFLHSQYEAMIKAGIPDDDAISELALLARQCGMEKDFWPLDTTNDLGHRGNS